MIVEFQESNCKMMKTIKKINEKKVLKNKAPTKSSEVVKTRKQYYVDRIWSFHCGLPHNSL